MAENQDPAFLFYSKDWLEGTSGMRKEEKGVFADLLALQHQKTVLPEEMNELARMVGMADQHENANEKFLTIWKNLGRKFKKDPTGGLYNPKLREVILARKTTANKHALVGVYAKLLRESTITDKRKKQIKSLFKLSNFFTGDTEGDTIRLTNWFNQLVNQSVNTTANGTENANGSLHVLNKGGEGGKFAAPTVEMVKAEMIHQGCPEINAPNEAVKFEAHHRTRGWKLHGGALMKDWKAAITTWLGKFYEYNNISPAKQARVHKHPGQL